jgi:glycosyltransferase involved in cell wall biosynthesis
MSESNQHDSPRLSLIEGIKRKFVGACAAAVVGGKTHASYLGSLGMAPERIFQGYDVVDNSFFIRGAEQARRSAASARTALLLPSRYLLASARLIPKKNLTCTILAYKLLTETNASSIPDLVILGDGPEKPILEKLASDLNLQDRIHFHGFQPYVKLPTYYALAEAFIHASVAEQWGLVVNEAMASGTPVIVSAKCGCSPDLVIDGHTGYQFDPHSPRDLAEKLERTVFDEDLRQKLSLNCQNHISSWDDDRFAQGVESAARVALVHQRPRSITTSSLVAALSRL